MTLFAKIQKGHQQGYGELSFEDLLYSQIADSRKHGVQRRMISVDTFFISLRLLFFCFVVAVCDLVLAVEAMYSLPYVLTASGNLF